MQLFQFQEVAAAQIADRFLKYMDDPVLAGSAKRPRTVPFFQALAALTGAGKTVVLADAVAQMSGGLATDPVVMWISRGKVVVRQSFANLSPGGKYHHLLKGARVAALADYSANTVREARTAQLFFATVGTFNEKQKELGKRAIFQSELDYTNACKHSARERSVLIMASGIAACDWCC